VDRLAFFCWLQFVFLFYNLLQVLFPDLLIVMKSSYRCVVISRRVFKREVPDIRSKLEANLTALRSAAKHQKGFIKSQNYTLSPFLKEATHPSSVSGAKERIFVCFSSFCHR
jgi:hypothetical protein